MRSDKKFDAVKMMREIRDKLSKEFVNLSYDEQKRYIPRFQSINNLRLSIKKLFHYFQ